MNLSVEHVLMFALVVCVFYYLMGKCDCKLVEGATNETDELYNCLLDTTKITRTSNANCRMTQNSSSFINKLEELRNSGNLTYDNMMDWIRNKENYMKLVTMPRTMERCLTDIGDCFEIPP